MAAQEQQCQRVVASRHLRVVHLGGEHRLLTPPPRAVTAPRVRQPPRPHRQQPCSRVVRHPLGRPLLGRGQQRLLHRVLTRVELAVPTRQHGQNLRRQLAQQALHLTTHTSTPTTPSPATPPSRHAGNRGPSPPTPAPAPGTHSPSGSTPPGTPSPPEKGRRSPPAPRPAPAPPTSSTDRPARWCPAAPRTRG